MPQKIITIDKAYAEDEDLVVRLDICLDQIAYMTRELDVDLEELDEDDPARDFPVLLTTKNRWEDRTEVFLITDIDADRVIRALNDPA